MNRDLPSLRRGSPGRARREFLLASCAVGLALAVLLPATGNDDPWRVDFTFVSAQTITTDTRGLVAGDVKVPVGKGEIPAYRAMPAEGGPFPVVLVVHEIWANHEYIKDVCRRLARQGYFAVAPDLYARQGDVARLKNNQEIFKVINKVPDAQVMADLDATAAWAGECGKGDPSRLGVTGFCWGGRIVWLYAAHNKGLRAGVAWYGHVVGGRDENHPVDKLHPKYPIDVVADLRAPVLGLYGEADKSIPVPTVERMRKALQEQKKPARIIVYPGMPHGFHADYRESYRRDAAEDGWNRMLAWFKKHGVK